MTLSIREQILVAINDQLDSLPDVTVYRGRRKPIAEAKLPALNQMAGLDRVTDEVYGFDKREMPVVVEGAVKADTDSELATALGELEALVVRTLLAGDRRLGGLAVDIVEGESDQDEADGDGKGPVAIFSRTFVITFFTGSGDPFAAGP